MRKTIVTAILLLVASTLLQPRPADYSGPKSTQLLAGGGYLLGMGVYPSFGLQLQTGKKSFLEIQGKCMDISQFAHLLVDSGAGNFLFEVSLVHKNQPGRQLSFFNKIGVQFTLPSEANRHSSWSPIPIFILGMGEEWFIGRHIGLRCGASVVFLLLVPSVEVYSGLCFRF